ncbi:glycosyltransferase family 4 protein [Flavobacterium sp. SORGH_AS_0622]|uniref:glycosyltransferase family 4 protein n=1 Tax=Flavobacterium sp. SORGH_AS_0622 TaxID=3041772 RepID=UPI00277F6FD0|nr:glycosyltransferase family 4 protein [Flavobacterium sp. SORGH_AS_0622]MDQ1167508.1 glycosyltransferase involved in cell wall biosynthesis [Flavobacterium sp. SORGH_AS_0622]
MNNQSILHVVNVYFVLPYFFGDQFLYLEKQGYDVHVICSPSENLKQYSEDKKFKYAEINILRSFSIIEDIKSLYNICLYIKKNNIETVVGHTPKGALLAMIAGSIMRVKKRIYFRHGLLYETSKGIKRSILIFAERFTSMCSTKIVCVSPSLAKKSILDKLNNSEKQIVIGKGTCGGIDSLNKFSPTNVDVDFVNNLRVNLNINKEDFVIGFCGRIVKDKGIVELVEAFIKLKSLNKDRKCKLLLVGGFEERDPLPLEIVNRIKNDDDIIVSGFIYENIECYYHLMSVYVLPSYREGFGMSVLEASSMCKPVLTTKVTGCVDSIIDGETGFFVDNNSNSIYQKLIYLMELNDLSSIQKKGRDFVVENFDNRVLWPIIEKQLYSTN